MASSTSFSCFGLNERLIALRPSWCYKDPNFFAKQSVNLKLMCLASGFENSIQRERFSFRNGIIQCNALEVEKTSSFSVGKKFELEDVIESQQFDRENLNAIFEVAREMEKIEKNSPGSQILKGYLMATLFYEPSTRTRLSFESAMKRLGGEVLTTENAREFSSAAKGETLEGDYLYFVYCKFFSFASSLSHL